MTHANRGRPLERAILRAATHYERVGRARVRHAPTPTRVIRGVRRFAGKAGADFTGTVAGGGAISFDAKSTREASWPLDKLTEDQRRHLDADHRLGARAGLVIDFARAGEVYWIGWAELRAFVARPWRESVSIDMARAWGVRLLEVGRGTRGWAVMFLEGVVHAERGEAVGRVEGERAGSGG